MHEILLTADSTAEFDLVPPLTRLMSLFWYIARAHGSITQERGPVVVHLPFSANLGADAKSS